MRKIYETLRGLGMLWQMLAVIPVDGTAGEDVVDLGHERATRTDRPDSVNVPPRHGDRTVITEVM